MHNYFIKAFRGLLSEHHELAKSEILYKSKKLVCALTFTLDKDKTGCRITVANDFRRKFCVKDL